MLKDLVMIQGDLDRAMAVMKEVAGWCEDTGKNMWKMDELSKENLLWGIAKENFYIGKIGNDNAAAMILQWRDFLFWPQIGEGQSGFIHKLCVRREFSGQGISQKMVAFAMEECKKKGAGYLRLDTGWDRDKLCSLYERLGFVKVGKKTVRERDYALYEMKIF